MYLSIAKEPENQCVMSNLPLKLSSLKVTIQGNHNTIEITTKQSNFIQMHNLDIKTSSKTNGHCKANKPHKTN